MTATISDKPLSREDVKRLKELRTLPNLTRIPLFMGLMAFLTWVAWTTDSGISRWGAYIGIGYLWMSMVTFMHDGTHNTLFRHRWANMAFGILCMIPLMASFIAFKEDHLDHHRYNRSYRDPDAFTMGKRGITDFIAFYAYIVAGAVLSFLHFNLLYPVQHFKRKEWTIHLFETVLKIACYWALLAWAVHNDVLAKTLEVWLMPVFFFSLFNSMRFIAEHYETPWNQGQLVGSRTILSNPVHSFFWNNINWHIGHHVYPSVPWYNLVKLHRLMEPAIRAKGAIVDRSYLAVFFRALVRGPETEERLKDALEKRQQALDKTLLATGPA
ncbi:MAG TPA: fatty acid desaturase [Gammaproteobacteria bacterium]|nr:fatty acid desaturase [Gammaproteobacteria bacterium]